MNKDEMIKEVTRIKILINEFQKEFEDEKENVRFGDAYSHMFTEGNIEEIALISSNLLKKLKNNE